MVILRNSVELDISQLFFPPVGEATIKVGEMGPGGCVGLMKINLTSYTM